jgi:hypothetical protein
MVVRLLLLHLELPTVLEMLSVALSIAKQAAVSSINPRFQLRSFSNTKALDLPFSVTMQLHQMYLWEFLVERQYRSVGLFNNSNRMQQRDCNRYHLARRSLKRTKFRVHLPWDKVVSSLF